MAGHWMQNHERLSVALDKATFGEGKLITSAYISQFWGCYKLEIDLIIRLKLPFSPARTGNANNGSMACLKITRERPIDIFG
jgi:hypothetical protein